MSKGPILVVEDERGMVDLVRMYLRREGFEVLVAYDGPTGLRKFREQSPALVILDLMLPGIDGWELCRQMRAESDVPIVMLTARDAEADRVAGLEMGADDYVTKPFSPRELVARVKAVLRRFERAQEARPSEEGLIWESGNVRIDHRSRVVTVDGAPVTLRPKEFDLLWVLAQNAGTVLSRQELLKAAWGYEFLGTSRTVDVHVGQLRRKLAAAGAHGFTIVTKWGVGYVLEKQ
jgi:DNA-binding response OmpR family regulator